jgi:Dockerin type I domain/FG-GAP-like repeat
MMEECMPSIHAHVGACPRAARFLLALTLGGFICTSAFAGGWVEFEEQTSTRLVADASVGTGDGEEKDYAWGDVDHDGDIDIVCVRKIPFTFEGGRRNVLLMNEGVSDGQAIDGVFVDRTAEFIPGFLDLTNDRDVVLADVNGDGWDDIITATTLSDGLPKAISHPRIYINQGMSGGAWQGFVYEEARIPQLRMISNGNPVAPRFCGVDAADVDNDGDVDLYFSDYDGSGAGGVGPNASTDLNDRLLINDGSGFFTDSLQERMTSQMLRSAFGMAVKFADMNRDGFVDVVKDTALNAPTYVSISYNNPDNPGFFDRFDDVYTRAPYHINVGDLNNDGWLDILVTDDNEDQYLLNRGAGANGMATFTRKMLGNVLPGFLFGGNNLIVDLDNDGFNDAIVADVDVDQPGCNRRTQIYRNLGDLPDVTLVEQGGSQPWTPRGLHDMAIFDFNNDGWNDMFFGLCDGVEIWINQPVPALFFEFPDGVPGDLVPGATTTVNLRIAEQNTTLAGGSVELLVSVDGGAFDATSATDLGDNTFAADLPGVDCASTVSFYLSAETSDGDVFTDPPGAPGVVYNSIAAFDREVTLDERFDTDSGDWTVQSTNIDSGAWVRVNPVGTVSGGNVVQPEDDYDTGEGETKCFVTGQHTGGSASSSDLDGGPTVLTSPVLDLAGTDAVIQYARWAFTVSGTPDALVTQITNNGVDWVDVEETFGTDGAWELRSFTVGDFVDPTSQVQVRFTISDFPNNSLTEAGIDSFSVNTIVCMDTILPELLPGSAAFSFTENAYGGYIDPRSESSDGVSLDRGLSRVILAFTEPVRRRGGGPLGPESFIVSETGGGTPPNIVDVETDNGHVVDVVFDRVLTLREWTTIQADVEDLAGNPILECGAEACENETDRIDVGFLPGDIDQNGTVTPIDLFRFRQYVNGTSTPPVGTLSDYVDTNRSGTVSPLDLFSFRQMINGVGSATQSWSGVSMNSDRP